MGELECTDEDVRSSRTRYILSFIASLLLWKRAKKAIRALQLLLVVKGVVGCEKILLLQLCFSGKGDILSLVYTR